MFLGGPPLVKMATGEDADDESLGGAEMHAASSGARRLPRRGRASTRIRIGREIVAQLNWRKLGRRSRRRAERPALRPRRAARHRLPIDLREPFDAREVIARIGVDGVALRRVQAALRRRARHRLGPAPRLTRSASSPTTACCSPRRREKATQFIQLANQIDTPLLFLQNTTGYMVGKQYEQGGIIKDGAKMINAVSNSPVPHLT